MKTRNVLPLPYVLFLSCCFQVSLSHKLVTYWGQNGVSSSVGPEGYERNLRYYCDNFDYDIIALGFLHVFFDKRNEDEYPSINLSYHCETFFEEYPTLLHCSTLAQEIIHCQRKNIKVIMSLGGAVGSYGFKTVSQAELFANRVWNLLLGGTSKNRPFDHAILDGVDLDIEGGGDKYYTEFVKELRNLMKTDSSKTYMITAAPQCPFPDARLGPKKAGLVLTDVPEEFDHIYVQFYNNHCYPSAGIFFNIARWLSFANTTNQTKGRAPKIFVGLPANVRASGHPIYYHPVESLQPVYEEKIKGNSHFGGFMLWDAGFDGGNIVNGIPYSKRLSTLLDRPNVTTTIVPVTKSTKQPLTTTTTTTTSTTTTTETTTEPQTTSTPSTEPSTEQLIITTTVQPTTTTGLMSNTTVLISTVSTTTPYETTVRNTYPTDVTTTDDGALQTTIATPALKPKTKFQSVNQNNSIDHIHTKTEHEELTELLLYVTISLLSLVVVVGLVTITLVCVLLRRKTEVSENNNLQRDFNIYANISELKRRSFPI